jgi:Protein of unknown function (DUF1579)
MKRLSYARLVIALVVTFAGASLVAAAQTPEQPPKPSPEVKKLDYFSGNWKSEGDLKPSPFGPGGKFSATEHNEWMQGGFFLLSHSDENTPMGSGKGLAVFGYDPNEKVYTYYAFNSMGQAEQARGTLAGDTWTWTNEEKMQGKMMRGRYTIKTLAPTSYTFKFEMAPEGGAWSTVMEGKATKTQ